ncbi:MAG: hypothetical protein DRJ64_05555 [Thermoprotei archaeon]|nr:MAG: hypothetical protein DRJ64_05555 [Thermoprotei archaeon]
MGLLNTTGKVFWHYFLILFSVVIFASTKSMNFSHIFDSPPLTYLQMQAVQIVLYLLIASGFVLAIVARIMGEKGSSGSAIFFGIFSLGLLLILLQVHGEGFVDDKWTREGVRNVFLLTGSLLGLVGVFGYTVLRLPAPPAEDLLARLLKEREEMAEEEATGEEAYCPVCGPNIRVPLTWNYCPNCGAEFAPGVDENGARRLKEKRVKMVVKKTAGDVEEEQESNIVDCPKCGGKMKISTDTRPVKVKCPHCGSIVLIK